MITLEEIGTKYPINIGAPEPRILCNDINLVLLFHVDLLDLPKITNKIKQRDSTSDTGVAIMKFKKNYIFKYGTPNDEVLDGHPYYNLGLEHYSFFEVNDSDWIKEIKKIESHHPYYNDNSFEDLKHYIITFKEKTFECIAEHYSIEYYVDTMENIFKKEFDSLLINSF